MPSLSEAREDAQQPETIPQPRPEVLWAALGRRCQVTTWRKLFRGMPEEVTNARRLTRLFFDDTAIGDDAELIVGELAANAVIHTRSGLPGGVYVLELVRTKLTGRITVYDLGGTGTPVFPGPPPDLDALHEHGHGLRTVALLAAGTGVRGTSATGHAVWAELPIATAVLA